jgi:hypothetical protein
MFNYRQLYPEHPVRFSAADAICDSLSTLVEIQTVSYDDLFFGLKIPQTEIWKNVNSEQVAAYSRKNLMLLNSMSEIVTGPLSHEIKRRVSTYSDQLSRACS